MTVRNDQPPLSRRELRDRARSGSSRQTPDESEAAQQAAEQQLPEPQPADQQPADQQPAGQQAADQQTSDRSGDDVPDAESAFAPQPASTRSSDPQRWFPPDQNEAEQRDSKQDGVDQGDANQGDAVQGGLVTGSASGADDSADGWQRPIPSDLSVPERTMTRRELRILRERAEAAGQPAPDVVFLPSGEATVTGMIPIQRDDARQPAAGEHGEQGESADSASEELAPEADAAGVVTEEPVDDDATAEDAAPPIADQPVIPALIEPLPASGVRFSTDAGRAEGISVPEVDGRLDPASSDSAPSDTSPSDEAVDAPVIDADVAGEIVIDGSSTGAGGSPDADDESEPEIVVDAEPFTDPVAEQDETVPEVVVEDTTPAPAPLRPFDAFFRRARGAAPTPAPTPSPTPPAASADETEPPSDSSVVTPTPPAPMVRADDLPSVGAVSPATDAIIDRSADPLESDNDGVRGDILAAPDSTGRPFGHWSTGADSDDATDAPTALTRDVGVTTGAVTTHALVLPSIPDAGDPLLSPLTSTGEIMVTGTIDLPRSFGSTGAHPALFDHPDVDALLDEADREDADSAAAPVRASRAVSSTTTTRAMIDADDGRKPRLLPIVLITSLVVGVAAAAFLAAAFIFRVI